MTRRDHLIGWAVAIGLVLVCCLADALGYWLTGGAA